MQPLAKRAKCIDIDVQPHVIHAFLIQSSGTFFSLKIAGGVDFSCILSLWRGNFFACEGEMAASWRVGSCRLRIEKGAQERFVNVYARQTVSLMRLLCVGTEMVRGRLLFHGVYL